MNRSTSKAKSNKLIATTTTTTNNNYNNNVAINQDNDDEILQSRLKKSSHMQQRQSVRSISDMPEIIGMHSISHTTNKDICSIILIVLTWSLVVLFFPFSFVFIFRVIQEYERGMKRMFFY
jgi:hypothetical protein